jgi:thiol-disulfide isomerase/thioredoxin
MSQHSWSASPSRVRIGMATLFAMAMLALIGSGPREVSPMIAAAIRLPVEGELPTLAGATGWLNSPALSPAGLRGKVVLVDFWTFTCVNWLRTLPYLRAWNARYKDKGLVVIGVHTPEFSVEHDLDNIRRAAKDMRVEYPIAVDNDYAVWRAFDNAYWPAIYIADAQGRIRFHHFGEGDYEQTERVIQQLLAEAGATGVGSELSPVEARGTEVSADWSTLRSGETYVGYEKAENFASPGGLAHDKSRDYSGPAKWTLNHWAFAGQWTVGGEIAVADKPKARIAFRFHARDVNLVMGAGKGGQPLHYRVLIDGHPPGSAHGTDVDAQGSGSVAEPRLYQLIRQPGPIEDRLFEIEFLDTGAEALCFTFG